MQVQWQSKATKQLLKIGDRKLRQRITDAVKKLHAWPDCSNIKALSNHKYDYRLRIANWRVFFDIIENEPVIISIEEVKKRDERIY